MNRFSVVIAGGGVAAIEGLLRLRRLAAPRAKGSLTLSALNANSSLGPVESEVSDAPLWPSGAKVSADELSDYLSSRRHGAG